MLYYVNNVDSLVDYRAIVDAVEVPIASWLYRVELLILCTTDFEFSLVHLLHWLPTKAKGIYEKTMTLAGILTQHVYQTFHTDNCYAKRTTF